MFSKLTSDKGGCLLNGRESKGRGSGLLLQPGDNSVGSPATMFFTPTVAPFVSRSKSAKVPENVEKNSKSFQVETSKS